MATDSEVFRCSVSIAELSDTIQRFTSNLPRKIEVLHNAQSEWRGWPGNR